ncbi:MAG: hypothetical protein GWP58_13170 [Gammaproteobacteria bacterium]|jgi:hypothetical protein|nr:hypothetical protein [Gammaproteobacteria bacterium]
MSPCNGLLTWQMKYRAVLPALGYNLLSDLSPLWLAFVQTFAGSAILMMLANTMAPEALKHGGKLAGIFTLLGFAACVWVIVLEHAGAAQHLMLIPRLLFRRALVQPDQLRCH